MNDDDKAEAIKDITNALVRTQSALISSYVERIDYLESLVLDVDNGHGLPRDVANDISSCRKQRQALDDWNAKSEAEVREQFGDGAPIELKLTKLEHEALLIAVDNTMQFDDIVVALFDGDGKLRAAARRAERKIKAP